MWRSACIAAIFAFHPLRVESIAWTSELKDVPSGLFFFLGLLSYEWYARRPGVLRYCLVLMLCFMRLLAKPMLITMFAVLLLNFWPLQRITVQASRQPCCYPRQSIVFLMVEKIPLFVVCIATALITIIASRKVDPTVHARQSTD